MSPGTRVRRPLRRTLVANRGFTLIEVMIAIAIFAVVGVLASQMLGNIIRQQEIIEQRGQRLSDLQRGMNVLQRDILQLTNRAVRDQFGDPLPSVILDDELLLEFTRRGWRNPLGQTRSELQRVAYDLREDKLYRYYWTVLDRGPESEPLEQVLMEGVLDVEFAGVDGNGDQWPQPGWNPADPGQRLAAISVRLDVEPFGELTRLWEVPDVLAVLGVSGGGTDGEGGAGDAEDDAAEDGPGGADANDGEDSQ